METRKIHQENYEEHFKKLWESFHSFKNLEIVGKSNQKISTSSVLLSICSQVLYDATKDIFKTRELDLEDKMVVILPDFSTDSIRRFVDYLLGRNVIFDDRKEEDDVLQLIEILRFGNFSRPENNEEREEVVDVNSFLDTSLHDGFKSEPTDQDNEDPDWRCSKLKLRPKLRLIKPKRVPESARDCLPVAKQEKRFKNCNWAFKVKPLIDDENEELDQVQCCKIDITKLNSSLEHLKDLTEDWQTILDFTLREDNKFRCPICYKTNFEKKTQAASHIHQHIQEIHDYVTICKLCKKRLRYETK